MLIGQHSLDLFSPFCEQNSFSSAFFAKHKKAHTVALAAAATRVSMNIYRVYCVCVAAAVVAALFI